MATLSTPLWYTALTRLKASDENTILQRLYDRDEELLTDLQAIQALREDLLDQFQRLDNLEGLFQGLNQTIDMIIRAFFEDLDGDDDYTNNTTFFVELIQNLSTNIDALHLLSSQIIRYEELKEQFLPYGERFDQLDDLDTLIKNKLDYIYGKWDVNPNDDILAI